MGHNCLPTSRQVAPTPRPPRAAVPTCHPSTCGNAGHRPSGWRRGTREAGAATGRGEARKRVLPGKCHPRARRVRARRAQPPPHLGRDASAGDGAGGEGGSHGEGVVESGGGRVRKRETGCVLGAKRKSSFFFFGFQSREPAWRARARARACVEAGPAHPAPECDWVVKKKDEGARIVMVAGVGLLAGERARCPTCLPARTLLATAGDCGWIMTYVCH